VEEEGKRTECFSEAKVTITIASTASDCRWPKRALPTSWFLHFMKDKPPALKHTQSFRKVELERSFQKRKLV